MLQRQRRVRRGRGHRVPGQRQGLRDREFAGVCLQLAMGAYLAHHPDRRLIDLSLCTPDPDRRIDCLPIFSTWALLGVRHDHETRIP